MGKAFIELRGCSRKYKLNADDIAKLYKISKRKTPSIPEFHSKSFILPETDDDCEVQTQNTLWTASPFMIFIFSSFLLFTLTITIQSLSKHYQATFPRPKCNIEVIEVLSDRLDVSQPILPYPRVFSSILDYCSNIMGIKVLREGTGGSKRECRSPPQSPISIIFKS